MKLVIFTDGASRGNPGPASYGFTVSDEKGKLICQQGRYIGTATNNVAEYRAVLESLTLVNKMFAQDRPLNIELFLDSKLVAEQLSGRFRVKKEHLKEIIEKIKKLAFQAGSIVYTQVPRSKNMLADKLANQALDNR